MTITMEELAKPHDAITKGIVVFGLESMEGSNKVPRTQCNTMQNNNYQTKQTEKSSNESR